MTHVKRNVKDIDADSYFLTIETDENLIGDTDPIPQENIGDSILNTFKSKPDFIGQIDAETGELVTFKQMRKNSIKCALWLKKVGVKKGDVITICSRNPSLVYVPFLASIYIGAIANPWEEKYFRDIVRVMYFLVINEPDVIFIDEDNFVNLLAAIIKSTKKIIKIVIIDEIKSPIKLNSLETILSEDFDQAEIDKFSCEKMDCMDSAIRTFSSTTKSYPGQVDVPYIAFTSPSNKETPVMYPNGVGLWYSSLCWTHGPLLTVHSILSYVTAVKSAVFSEDNLYKTIEKYTVTWVFLESDMCNQLLNTEEDFLSKYDVSSLETLLFDNWSIHHFILEQLAFLLPDVSVIRVYSKPETGVIAYQRDSDLQYRSAGYVAKNIQLAFIGPHFKLTGPNEVSTIYCKTPYITCNKHKKRVQPWYYTSDRGYYDENGKIFVIVDTFKHYIRYKNVAFIPEVFEYLMYLHPAVFEVIVAAVRHPIDFQHPIAYVKTRPGAKVTEEELVEFVKRNSDGNCPFYGGIHFITDEIPRLPNGKINRDFFRLLKD